MQRKRIIIGSENGKAIHSRDQTINWGLIGRRGKKAEPPYFLSQKNWGKEANQERCSLCRKSRKVWGGEENDPTMRVSLFFNQKGAA